MKKIQTIITRATMIAMTLAGMTCFAQSEAPATAQPDLEVEVRILQFNRKMIEAISRTNTIDRYVIVSLFKSGEGELVAAPVVRTRPGEEACLRSVVEYVYPTSFEREGRETTQAVTNESIVAQGNSSNTVSEETVVPQDFATREVGTILAVKSDLDANKRIARLTLTPQCVFEPVWRSYGYKNSPAKQPAPMEQPFFPVISFSAEVSMSSDSTVLIGGGIPNADGTKMVYMLATVRIMDVDVKHAAK